MKKKIYLFFFVIIFFLFQNKLVFSQIENSVIISVGDYPITRLDLLKEIKLIAIYQIQKLIKVTKNKSKA